MRGRRKGTTVWYQIKIGKNTRGHVPQLQKLGYTVLHGNSPVTRELVAIWAPGPRPGAFLATPANLERLASWRGSLSYRTLITFPDGKVMSSILAAQKLGAWSCLMMK